MTKIKRHRWSEEEIRTLHIMMDDESSSKDIARVLDRTVESVENKRHQLNLKRRKLEDNGKRPMPADFVEHYGKMSHDKLRLHYRCGSDSLYRWISESGVKVGRPTRPLVIPADWFELAPTMTRSEMRMHFCLGKTRLAALIQTTGIEPRKPMWMAEKAPDVKEKFKRGSLLQTIHAWRAPTVGTDLATNAAHYLRKFYSNVFRANIRMFDGNKQTWGDVHELPNSGNDYYVVGRLGPMLLDDVVELARKNGFQSESAL